MSKVTKIPVNALTNKNRLEYTLGINASENRSELDNKYSLYRAYAYMKNGNDITLSDPVFFQIYDYAIKSGNV